MPRVEHVERQDEVVYYLHIGDHIKIGHTGNLRRRLRAYPPNAVLLASEPGGANVERERHEQFRDLRAHRREWYIPGATLVRHIEALREPTDAELHAIETQG